MQTSRFNVVEIALLGCAAAVFLASASYLTMLWHYNQASKQGVKLAVARIVTMNNSVRIRANNSNQWMDASPNDPVSSHDVVFTDRSSNATLEFVDSSRIELGENALVEVATVDGDASVDIERGLIKIQTSKRPMRVKLGKKQIVLRADTPSKANLSVSPDGAIKIQPLTESLNLELDGKKVDVPMGQQLQASISDDDDEVTISPAKFMLNVPDDDMMFPQGKDVAFAWQINNKSNDEIFFELSSTSNFATLIQRSAINTTSSGMSFKFANSGEFHWRLAANNEFSESREFIVKNVGQMTIIIPAEGEKVRPPTGNDCLPVSFAAVNEPLCDRYDFELLAENSSDLDKFEVSLPQNTGSTVLCAKQWTIKSRCMRGELEVLGWSNARRFSVSKTDETSTPAKQDAPIAVSESKAIETPAPLPITEKPATSTTVAKESSPSPEPKLQPALAALSSPEGLEFELMKKETSASQSTTQSFAKIRWTSVPEATKYAIEIATDTGFTKTIHKDSVDATTSFNWTGCKIGMFSARVIATARDGRRSPPSQTKTLTIPYARPKLVEPEYEAEYIVSEPTRAISFTWKPAACDSDFDIEVCEDKSDNCFYEKSVNGSSTTVDHPWKAGWYKWRIKSKGSQTPDDWTSFRSFLIKRENP